MNPKPIKYTPGLFAPFLKEPNAEAWEYYGFSTVMLGLGYEVDCFETYQDYLKTCKHIPPQGKSLRERRRRDLYILENAPKEIVGSYLYNEWRRLMHWDSHYDPVYAFDFLHRILSILEAKYEKDYN